MANVIHICTICTREQAQDDIDLRDNICFRDFYTNKVNLNYMPMRVQQAIAIRECEAYAISGGWPVPSSTQPIPMILFCPMCRTQHVDKPERDSHAPCSVCLAVPAVPCYPHCTTWKNPPHKSHLCGHCGLVWRPADVPTVGVEQIKTAGKDDSFRWPFAAKAIFKAVMIDYDVLHAFSKEIERSGVGYNRLCEAVRRAIRFHLPDPNDHGQPGDYEVRLATANQHCKDCPHKVGDSYQRDCSFPDCYPEAERIMGLHRTDRKEAEQIYTTTAFDYERNPVGSNDWCLWWKGWRAHADKDKRPDCPKCFAQAHKGPCKEEDKP